MTHRILIALMLLVGVCACNIKDEGESFRELDRLRVLALRAEPPDLLPGEQSTLSALVFEPEDRALSYVWSWCPARHGKREGFTCAIEEEALREIWETLDTDEALPPYDLGTEPEVLFHHVFTPEVLFGVCQALTADEEENEFAILSCFWGLQVSVELRVSTDNDEVVAIKTLELLEDEKAPPQRNKNPELSSEIEVTLPRNGKDRKQDHTLEDGEALEEGLRYELQVQVADDQAEKFTPQELKGVDVPDERKETLYMSWFATTLDGGFRSTAFVDDQEGKGDIDLEGLTTNDWGLPPFVASSEARLIVVLRDERGGVGWMEYSFPVEKGD